MIIPNTNTSIMWTQMIIPRNVRHFVPNYFVVLKEIRSGQVKPIVINDETILQNTKIQDASPISSNGADSTDDL